MNKQQVTELLTIQDKEKETVFGIIGRMEVLLTYFREDKKFHGLLPFLTVYYLVTKAVAEKYVTHKHYFWSVKEIQRLDVYFASLYFTPLLAFLEHERYEKPWYTYYDYCSNDKGIPSLKMLLGINAHINADLCTSLVHTKYRSQKDFFLVNDILQEVIPNIMMYLATAEKDIFGLGGVFFKDFFQKEFHDVIERWRSEAWVNAQQLQTKNPAVTKASLADSTEMIGKELIAVITDAYHLEHIPSAVKKVNTLSTVFL